MNTKLDKRLEDLLRDFDFYQAEKLIRETTIGSSMEWKQLKLIDILADHYGDTGNVNGDVAEIIQNALENIGVNFDEE